MTAQAGGAGGGPSQGAWGVEVDSGLIAAVAGQDFMRRGLASVIVLAFGVAPVGVFLMLRRMSLMGDAMSHAILPGVAAGFLLSGMNRVLMTIGGLRARL